MGIPHRAPEFRIDGPDAMSSSPSPAPDVNLACPGCAVELRVPATVAHRRIQCPACALVFDGTQAAQASKPPSVEAETVESHDSDPGFIQSRINSSQRTNASAVDAVAVDAVAVDASAVDAVAVDAVAVDVVAVDSNVIDANTVDASVVDANIVDASVVDRSKGLQGGFPTLPSETQWRLRTPEMIDYGPVTAATLESWVREGRVTGDCELRQEEDARWRRADSLFPVLSEPLPLVHQTNYPQTVPAVSVVVQPTAPPLAESLPPSVPKQVEFVELAPHRGPFILILGILSLIAPCPLFSIPAWVMGSTDFEEISRGRMDPAGLTLTRIGKRLGMWTSIAWITLAAATTIGTLYVAAI